MIFVIAGFGSDVRSGDQLPSVPLSRCHPPGTSRARRMPPRAALGSYTIDEGNAIKREKTRSKRDKNLGTAYGFQVVTFNSGMR